MCSTILFKAVVKEVAGGTFHAAAWISGRGRHMRAPDNAASGHINESIARVARDEFAGVQFSLGEDAPPR